MSNELMVGRNVVANWGAMFPTEWGTVVDTGVGDQGQPQIKIQWEETAEWLDETQVREPGECSANGSPIGIYWEYDPQPWTIPAQDD